MYYLIDHSTATTQAPAQPAPLSSIPGTNPTSAPGMGASELKKFDEYVGELAKSKARKRAHEEQDENENEMVTVPKPKKKQLNADQRLVMAGSQILCPVEN
ncbi:hypothetical protein B0H10DRAFT_1944383 [Mycena sp. CBHHK59/15]|nr:hypothetical protein B0H10DRAFT_1944383 [Mycena sp. CBHHK59/15]